MNRSIEISVLSIQENNIILEFEALCGQYIKTEIYQEICLNVLSFTQYRLRRLSRNVGFNIFSNSKKI